MLYLPLRFPIMVICTAHLSHAFHMLSPSRTPRFEYINKLDNDRYYALFSSVLPLRFKCSPQHTVRNIKLAFFHERVRQSIAPVKIKIKL